MRRALAFLTPIGGARAPDARTLGWFPAAGALIGGAVGAIWWAAGHVWPPVLAAAVAVGFDLAVTGLLHLDGLADAADGLLPQVPRSVRLQIMAEPTVGAYAVAVVGIVLALRVAALASMSPNVMLVAALWCSSRTVMAVAARSLAYVRAGGLATDLVGGRWTPVAFGGVAMSLGLAACAGGPEVAAVFMAWVVGSAAIWVGERRLGGFTGDVLGAAGVLAETAGLIVAAARW